MAKATKSPTKATPAAKKTTAKSSSSNKGNSGNGGGPQKILDLALMLEGRLGTTDIPRQQLAAMSGVKANTFVVTISNMKNKQGWIEYDKDSIRLTDAGRAKARIVDEGEVMVDNETVQADVKKKFKLGGQPGLLFDALTDGRAHDREATAAAIGCTNKATLAVMLSNLKKKGIIEYDRNTIRLTDMCFAFGGRPESL